MPARRPSHHPASSQRAADCTSFAHTQRHPYEDVFNTQMIIDVDANATPGAITRITISRPVLQRMLDGRTKGIVLIPLGSIEATFLTGDSGRDAPTLRFNLER